MDIKPLTWFVLSFLSWWNR